jgi:ElaB/YqjD/DUF883 family membrane-anchored ribosome-binding protein
MGSGILTSVVAVAGFTGLGVAAMYLLDPEMGERRRAAIRSATGDATSSTDDAFRATVQRAGGAVKTVAHSAEDLAHKIADRLSDHWSSAKNAVGSTRDAAASGGNQAASAVGDQVSWASNQARGFWNRASRSASDAHDEISAHRAKIRSGVSTLRERIHGAVDHLAGKHEEHRALALTGHTAGTVGVLAIGAGAMYFLDPAKGPERRSEIVEEVRGWVRRAGHSIRGYGEKFVSGAHDAGLLSPGNEQPLPETESTNGHSSQAHQPGVFSA